MPGASPSSTIVISAEDSTVSIHRLGATIISWNVGGRERLFVSTKAIWDGSKPIRGGIPLVFPQFGTGPFVAGQHGFARNQPWEIQKAATDTAICILRDNEATRALWPRRFELIYTVRVFKDSLRCELKVTNPSDSTTSFPFACLLHTYFAIDDISSVRIDGLGGCQYKDRLSTGWLETEGTGKPLTIEREVDRTYIHVNEDTTLNSSSGRVKIIREGFPDVVVWNPWIEKAKTMTDLDDLEYKKMVCIEAGWVDQPQVLDAGQSWKASQTLLVIE